MKSINIMLQLRSITKKPHRKMLAIYLMSNGKPQKKILKKQKNVIAVLKKQ
jgi:hypothetical protein